ncbi:gliding motility-associated C-terminal domain-containing protein, partial [Leeuwenhoekiella marinoflava]|uniref:gliding motility-associated C-terminal domain-containing protein n=1 Tax=Leeuwenhoekiella marinoflava TaxID=988 RepID=UPI003001A0A1
EGEDVTDTSDDNSNLEDDETVTELPKNGSIGLIKTGVFNDENGDGYAQVGETITYDFTVTNTGNVTITGTVIDDARIGVDALGITPSNLAPGATGTATAEYAITQSDIDAGFVSNSALATGKNPSGDDVTDTSDNGDELNDDDGDGDPGNDPTITNTPGKASLSLEKVGVFNDENGDQRPQVGETITYTFTVYNTGEVAISDLVIEDPLVEVSGGPIDLEPGEIDATTFTAVYSINQADIEQLFVENQAFISGVLPDGEIIEDLSDDPNNDDNVDVNENGNPDDVTITIIPNVLADGDIIIYNVMTPNGDGLNDIFMIENIDRYPDNKVQIFNRWGVEVYSTEGYSIDNGNVFSGFSDGRATVRRGERLPTGTYYYVIEYADPTTGAVRNKASFLYIN